MKQIYLENSLNKTVVSVYDRNDSMKQLKFSHQYAQAIVRGEKTSTFRVNDDKDIVVGDRVQLVDKVDTDHPRTWLIPGELVVTAVEDCLLRDLSRAQKMRAESFDNLEEMIHTFRRFYGEHIDEATLVKIITFQYEPFTIARPYLVSTVGIGQAPERVSLYADGGSRGNPGPSAYGFVVLDEQRNVLHADNEYLGITTNNQAEYHGVIAGMEWCLEHQVRIVDIYLDSMLVVNQLKGIFKVKNRDLWTLFESAKELTGKFREVHVTHVPRELNKLADGEVNRALDAVRGSDIVQ